MSDFKEIPSSAERDENNILNFSEFEEFEYNAESISECRAEAQSDENPVARLSRVIDEQKINFLHSEILEAASDDGSHDFYGYECATPLGISQAVAVAGKILRENPNAKLTDKPIELPSDHTDLTEKVALETLVSMVNGSLGEVPEEEMSKYRVECGRTASLDTCSRAEQLFDETFKQMKDPTATLEHHAAPFGYRIITDGLTPVAVTKDNCVPSSITLEPVTVGEVTYPPGSLFNIHLLDDYKAAFNSFKYIRTPMWGQTEHDFKHVIKAGFIRLSSFASKPDHLQKFRLIAEEAATVAKKPKPPIVPKWLIKHIKNL